MKTAIVCSERTRRKLLIRSKFVERIKLRDRLNALLEPEARDIGLERERKAEEALRELKETGEIIDYVKTERFSVADVIDGVDFYVISFKDGKRIVTSLDICGYSFVDEKKEKHKDVVPFPVAITESQAVLIMKILRLVR